MRFTKTEGTDLQRRVAELEQQVALQTQLLDILKRTTEVQGSILKAVAQKLGIRIETAPPKSGQQ